MKEFLSEVLSQIAENLDLTDTQEKTIKKAYERVADWLNEKDSCLSAYDVEIYPQGSMKIGTVVKPLKTDDYDGLCASEKFKQFVCGACEEVGWKKAYGKPRLQCNATGGKKAVLDIELFGKFAISYGYSSCNTGRRRRNLCNK